MDEELRATREEVIAFLKGLGPLEGCWFGDKPPHERGNYWWRKYLRALSPSPETIEASMRVYAEAAMHHGFQAAARAVRDGRIDGSWERDWFERNPPAAALRSRTQPSTPSDEGISK